MPILIFEFNRVDRSGDTMEGDLDFDTFSAKFVEHEIKRVDAFALGLGPTLTGNGFLEMSESGGFADFIFDTGTAAYIMEVELSTKSLTFGLDSKFLVRMTGGGDGRIALFPSTGLAGAADLIEWSNDGSGSSIMSIKGGQSFKIDDGTNDLVVASDGVFDLSGMTDTNTDLKLWTNAAGPQQGDVILRTDGNSNFLFLAPDGAGGSDQILSIAKEPADPAVQLNFIGGSAIGVGASGINFWDGTRVIFDLFNGLLDLSGMTVPSELKLTFYDQAAIPALDANGKVAVWEDADDESVRIVTRNSAGVTAPLPHAMSIHFSKDESTPYLEDTNAAYQVLGHIIYPGSDHMPLTAFRMAISRAGATGAVSARLFDFTNSNTVGEITGITSASKALYADATLSNVPTGPAILEVQALTSGDAYRIHSAAVE